MTRTYHRLVAGLAAAELPVVILIAPALLFPSPTRLLVLLVIPLVWLSNRHGSGHLIPPTPFNAALLVLLAMVGVSLWATFDIVFSLGKVSGVVLGLLLFWAIARWTTTTARLELALVGFLFAGAALAVIGLVGTDWIDKFRVLTPIIDRLPKLIRGLPGAQEGFQPNAVAGVLVLFVPLQIAVLAGTGRRTLRFRYVLPEHRRVSLLVQMLLLALTAGTLLLTQSRGAWVGMVAAGAAFCLWHSRRTRLIAAAGAAGAVALAVTLGPERLLNLAISQSGPGMAGNITGRMELWSRALYGIQDFPFTGMGMNTFRKVMPVLYPTFLTSPDVDVAHAHNHLLQAALDLGIPGLIAYSAIWLIAATLLVRVYRRPGRSLHRPVAAGLGAGLIAHFVFSLTDAIPLGAKVGILFWFTLALITALHHVARLTAPEP